MGERKKGSGEKGPRPPRVPLRVPAVLRDNSPRVLRGGGSPPESRACISITQILIKVLGLMKKKKKKERLARGECA